MVYMKADAEQYNYKMYRWRSTYLAAANNYKQYTANNYKQYTAYSTELNGARGVRATSCSWLVCKMEITSRECYSFCVISSRVVGISRSLSSM